MLAKGPNGEDPKQVHIVIFDEQLKYKKHINGQAFEEEGLTKICGITVDKAGFLYATDGEQNCIKKFKLHEGKFISRFGEKGSGDGHFNGPTGLWISKLSYLFVCDRHNHRIQVFHDKDFMYKFGKQSRMIPEPGTFRQPVDITMNNSEDKLFITDWHHNRVQVFTPEGKFIQKINIVPEYVLLIKPNGIFFTPDNHLLVASTINVLVFKEDGTFVSVIDGIHDRKRRFSDCIGILMMNDGKIVIGDGHYGTKRLVIF